MFIKKLSPLTSQPIKSITCRLAVSATAVVLLAACSKQPAAAPEAIIPEVKVITAQATTVPLQQEFHGRLEASRSAEIRARVAGVLTKRLFTEGSQVKAGQALFSLDNAPYATALASAHAALANAKASHAQNKAQQLRLKPLVEINAISKQEYELAQTAAMQSDAQVQMAAAAVKTAQINLNYANITAPISGKIGRSFVTEGALVGYGDTTKLALIQQTDPLYVNFNQSSSQVLQLQKAIASGEIKAIDGNIPVQIILEDGSLYGESGQLLFADAAVDEITGQISLRASINNQQGQLLPGMYVRVLLQRAQVENAYLIPQQAVSRTSNGDSAIVINTDGSFAKKPLTIIAAKDNNWIVSSGLTDGDMVLVEGSSKLLMGAQKVKPMPWKTAVKNNTATPAAAANDEQ